MKASARARTFVWLALLTLASLSCGSSRGAASHASGPAGRGEPAWTLLVYMAADDDLEQAALLNVQEMAEVGSGDAVNVIVQIDRAPAGKSGGGYSRASLLNLKDFHTTKRLRVEHGELVELQELGETCTCDPEPLAAFVAWGVTSFPAQHTALVLWDHGGASHGFGWDVTSENKPISIADIAKGIRSGLAAAGQARFDVLGFDACLMSNLGVAYELRHASDIFIGSEEFEPQAGWTYGPIVRAMSQRATPHALAEAVVNSFMDECRRTKAEDLCTLTAYETANVDNIVLALDDLGGHLLANAQQLHDWYPIARARTASEQYGAGAGDQSPYATVDAVDFATRVARTTGSANRVTDAVSAATLYGLHGLGRPSAHGLSITFPRQPSERAPADETLELTKRPDARWDAFLRTYVETVSADRTPPTVRGLAVLSTPDSVDASGTLPDLDLADISGIVGVMDAAGGLTLRSLAPAPPEGSHAHFRWTRTLPAFGDDRDVLPVTVFAEKPYAGADGRNVQIASLGGVLYPHGVVADGIDAVVYLKLSASTGPVLEGVYRRTDGGAGSELALHADDRLAPAVATVAIEGRITHVASKATIAIGDPTKLRLVEAPAPPGNYAVGFRLIDYAANRRWEIMNVVVGQP